MYVFIWALYTLQQMQHARWAPGVIVRNTDHARDSLALRPSHTGPGIWGKESYMYSCSYSLTTIGASGILLHVLDHCIESDAYDLLL